MRNNIQIFLSLVLILSSCTQDIQLDLNSSDPQIVIEGSIPLNGKAKVTITKSSNFDQSNSFNVLNNANVTLTDNTGNSELLQEITQGIYASNEMVGVTGRTYMLSVKALDKTISAEGKIPNPVKFDSLNVEVAETFGRPNFDPNVSKGTLYSVTVFYHDPIAEKNYYRFIEYINGVSTGTIYVSDDRLTNGKPNIRNLFNFNRYLRKGDSITVEMQSIDQAVYEYFNSFENAAMGPGASTPANPFSNLKGAVLGYFSAHTSAQKTVKID